MTDQQPIVLIGITGGIGSGKSLIGKIFHAIGIPVFNADVEAKLIVESNPILISEIKELLGDESYIAGKYNRKFVGDKVFNDVVLLSKLNSLIHPKVRERAIEWCLDQRKAAYFLYEAALMKAAGDSNPFKRVIVVKSPLNLRIERVKQRDGRSENEIKSIIQSQISDEDRQKIADYIINNDEENSLIDQVLRIHQSIIESIKLPNS